MVGRKVAGVEAGSRGGSALLPPVSLSPLFSALSTHLFLLHLLNGMSHLPWEPRGG